MGLALEELSLDLNCGFVPKSISDLLTEISVIHDIPMKLSKLNDYVYMLEQEMKKIDAFKRELPLCMLLLNDAIAKLEEEEVQLKKREVEAGVMQEFMPLKGNSDEAGMAKKSADFNDKKNWMSSAQLWTTPIKYEPNFDAVKFQDSFLLQESRYQERNDEIGRGSQSDKSRSFGNKGGPFIPFKKLYEGSVKTEVEENWAVDDLSLSIPAAEMGSVDTTGEGKIAISHDSGVSDGSSSQSRIKKQRRYWSQELHQRFLNALQNLGGAQAATPRQIREIMQVDGLTNDEIKSHLQKYRLHIHKLQKNSSSSASPDHDCLRRGECSDLPTGSVAQSGSPEGPLQLGGSAKGASVTGGESMDEEEDSETESHSWKGRLHKLAA